MSKKTEQKHKGICVLCGKEEYLTREHVPPKNLFSKPRPKNTITAWTCKPCNASYSQDEEYFRIYIAAGASPDSDCGRLWKEKVENSTFSRSPALRQKLSDGMDVIQQYHKLNPLKDFDGKPIPDELIPYALPLESDRICRVIKKIIRCLYFKHFKFVLSPEIEISISTEPLTEVEVEKIVIEHKGFVGNKVDNLFIYWFDQQEKDGSIDWILLFQGGFKYFRATIKM
ncbi:MAG: hypothetical protein WC770_01475 [Phycisphaerae bacterium]